MNLKKISLLLTSAALITSLVGCFGDDDDDAADGITITSFAVTGPTDDSYWITGSVNADAEIDSVTFDVKDSAGVLTNIDVWYVPVQMWRDSGDISSIKSLVFSGGTNDEVDLDAEIEAVSVACGTFTVEAKVYAGGSSTATAATTEFTKSTGCGTVVTPDLTEQTAEVGGTSNATLGSSVDLDSWNVYLSAAARENVGSIDLVYGVDRLYTASAAKEAALSVTAQWDAADIGSVLLATTSLTRAQYEAVVTRTQLLEVAAAALAVEANIVDSAPVSAGAVFAVSTTDEALFLILIDEHTAGGTGSIKIKAVDTL